MTESKIAKMFDLRLIDRNLRSGVINPAQVEAHLSALPDMATEAEMVSFDSRGNEEARELPVLTKN